MSTHLLVVLSAYNGERQFKTHFWVASSANVADSMGQNYTHFFNTGSA